MPLRRLPAALLLSLGATLLTAAPSPDDVTALRLVADHVVKETTRRVVDRSDGKTYEDSSALAPKPEITVESKFNAWFYQTWLLTDGMRRTAATLDEPSYRGYGEANLAFFTRHLPFFRRQRDAKMTAAPAGDGKLSPVGFYFNLTSLWNTGLAPLALEHETATKDGAHAAYLARVRRLLATAPHFEDGAFYRPGKGMMTDDPYMTVPFLVREWRASQDETKLDLAIAQVLGTHARLLDPEKKILLHLWDLRAQKPAGVFWGRGNGWVVLAHVELLAALPKEHPRRPEVLAAFVRHMEGLRACADPAGGWHQVLDHPESWLETSATGMITYGLARGVNEGWLDASFAPAARGGWKALRAKITPEGDVLDVCGSTDTGDLAYYLKRPRLRGDLHGFGSLLLAGAEVLKLRP